MTNGRSLRGALRGSACVFVGFATLACFIGDPERDPPSGSVADARVDDTPAVVTPTDTGVVDSGPATGPPCRGDLDCTSGVRTHCLLDPGREGFCVQCAPEQGFTCADGRTCSGGVCVQCDPAAPCTPGSACVNGTCVGQGALRFTLTWDRPGDLDLHVVTPGGREIYYAARSQDGGELDRDDTTATGPENVFWAATPPAGAYLVCVVPFSVTGATTFRLSVVRTPGGEALSLGGTRAMSTGNVACTRGSPNFVTEFRY